jgi:Na+-driven multidrug efflux pump
MQHEARLIEGPVARTLMKLSAPMVVAMFAMVGFNIVDNF